MPSIIRPFTAAMMMTGALFVAALPATAQTAKPVETVPPKATTLPADVNPESKNRLPLVKRENMDEQGQKAYDAVVDPKSRLRAELIGPAGIWLHVPELSPHIREINWYLRNKVNFDPAMTELIILATVRETDGQTEWAAHEVTARKVGLDGKYIDMIKYRQPIEGVPPKEAVVMKLARELIGEKRLSSPTYAEALKQFGQKDLINMVLLIANYSQTSLILHAFDQQLRPELTPLLPVVNYDKK